MSTYITKEGDAWDSIAKNLLGDEFSIDALLEAQYHGTLPNGSNLLDYILLPDGISITVTETEKVSAEIFKAPWE